MGTAADSTLGLGQVTAGMASRKYATPSAQYFSLI